MESTPPMEAARMSSEDSTQIVNVGDADHLDLVSLRGLRPPGPLRQIAAHALCIVLLGLPYLLCHWRPRLKAGLFYAGCPLRSAEAVMVDSGEVINILEIVVCHCDDDDGDEFLVDGDRYRVFVHQCVRFAWSVSQRAFVPLRGIASNAASIAASDEGLRTEIAERRSLLYGSNTVDVKIKSYGSLLFREVLNPFYVFQAFSVVVWSLDDYYYYASCILFISLVSIAYTLKETRRQSVAMHEIAAKNAGGSVVVMRSGEETEVSKADLVPGDAILLPRSAGLVMPCDAVVITADSECVVNESVLTGESMPVTKTSLADADAEERDRQYDARTFRRQTLFAGTHLIQAKSSASSRVFAVVVRTGFGTAKGELIRSILHPRPIGLKFYRDSIRFFCFMFLVALVGMAYSVYLYVRRGVHLGLIVRRTLDIITIVIPPALPAAMTVGTYHAQQRLKAAGIFCISPQRINVAGMLDVVCFDKTGTLTEDTLDVEGVVRGSDDRVVPVSELQHNEAAFLCMSACHSLASVDSNSDLIGDPMEVKMFRSTGCLLEVDESSRQTVIVTPSDRRHILVKLFPFSAAMARMSVIVKHEGGSSPLYLAYVKGAPEVIEGLCQEGSLPRDFHDRLQALTKEGLRVIAMASKYLEASDDRSIKDLSRQDVETGLTFLCFCVFQTRSSRTPRTPSSVCKTPTCAASWPPATTCSPRWPSPQSAAWSTQGGIEWK